MAIALLPNITTICGGKMGDIAEACRRGWESHALEGGFDTALQDRPEATVLIVDDLDELAEAALRAGMTGCEVRVARSARELAASLRIDGLPDLLLLNDVLPDADGFDVLAEMRWQPQFARVRIVMLTTRHDPADFDKSLALGAAGCVAKPYSRKTLEKVLETVLM
jgi:two-component system, OmpR family, response regulator